MALFCFSPSFYRSDFIKSVHIKFVRVSEGCVRERERERVRESERERKCVWKKIWEEAYLAPAKTFTSIFSNRNSAKTMGGLKRIIECPCRCGTHRINPPFAEPARRDEYCHENSHSEQKLRDILLKKRDRERERERERGKWERDYKCREKKRKGKKKKKRREGREKEPWGLNFLRWLLPGP